eukprot:Polyplicarium_translucidae@DN2916_c0_g1_i2.p1
MRVGWVVVSAAVSAVAVLSHKEDSADFGGERSFGDSMADFVVMSVDDFQQFGLEVTSMRHTATNATVLSFVTDGPGGSGDTESAFMTCFATPPSDDTGVSHIFEHCALGGSSSFPLEEPFSALLKSSVATYLNAATYPDMTCYPFASVNEKDFLNVMRVYLDGMFLPLAVTDGGKRFSREGWHYELSGLEDELTYEGVVFSEMQGVYSQHIQILIQEITATLMPDTPYRYNFGGLPESIPDLSYDDLIDFYRKFYTKSNAVVFLYGPKSMLPARLKLLSQYLHLETRIDNSNGHHSNGHSSIRRPRDQVPMTTPGRSEVQFEPTATEGDAVGVGWLLETQQTNASEFLSIDLLGKALIGTPAAPLYAALSTIGPSVLNFDFQGINRQSMFAVGVDGIKDDQDPRESVADKVEALVVETLRRLAADGIPDAAKRVAVTQSEFEHREGLTGSRPSGFNYFHLAIGGHKKSGDYFHFFQLNEAMAEIREQMDANPRHLEDLLQRYFVDNPARVTVHAKATPSLHEAKITARRASLAAIKESMTTDELQTIVEKTVLARNAAARSDSPSMTSMMPHLAIADVAESATTVPTVRRPLGSSEAATSRMELLEHPIKSNGVIYTKIAVSLNAVKFDDIPFIRLFADMLEEAGTHAKPEEEWVSYVNAVTGGLTVELISGSVADHPSNVANDEDAWAFLVLEGKALRANVPDLLGICKETIAAADMDKQPLARRLARRDMTEMAAAFISEGHTFASKRAASRLTMNGWFADSTTGIGAIEHVKATVAQIDDDWQRTLAHLERLQRSLAMAPRVIIDAVADAEDLEAIRPHFEKFAREFEAVTLKEQQDRWIVSRDLGETASGDSSVSQTALWVIEGRPKLPQFVRAPAIEPGLLVVDARPAPQTESFEIPSSVGYLAMTSRLVSPGHSGSPSFAVAAKALSNGYLWENVRLANSAYGVWATWDPRDGLLRLGSFRDPNVTKSLEVFGGCDTAAFSLSEKISPRALADVTISVIGDLDRPFTPDSAGTEGLIRHIRRDTTETQNVRRTAVLQTSREDLAAFATRLAESLRFGGASCALQGKVA